MITIKKFVTFEGIGIYTSREFKYYRSQPDANAIPLPELSVELAHVGTLDLAWQSVKIGFKLTITAEEKTQANAQGWQLISLHSAIARMNLPRTDARSLPRLFER